MSGGFSTGLLLLGCFVLRYVFFQSMFALPNASLLCSATRISGSTVYGSVLSFEDEYNRRHGEESSADQEHCQR